MTLFIKSIDLTDEYKKQRLTFT